MDEYKLQQYEKDYFDYLVDIGACVGMVSCDFAKRNPGAKIYAYEPCKSNYKELIKNTKKIPNIFIINKALGNGNYLFFKDMKRKDRHLFLEKKQKNSYKIKSVSFPDIFSIHNINLGEKCALKIDCEGGEQYLLDNQETTDIIKRCSHVAIEIHFKHKKSKNKWFNIFPKWETYDNWIQQFDKTHNILYWKSSKYVGHGIYILEKKIPKIFGIGLGRTGTKSLAKAMAIMGCKAKHGIRYVDDIVEYDFVNDIAVSWRFDFLDYVYPGSKFILTIRDFDDWMKASKYYSEKRRVTREKPRGKLRRLENRYMLFKTVFFEYDKFKNGYEDFHNKVFEHFKDREEDLLVMNIVNGDGWEKLCKFLRKEIPDIPFPHKNKSNYNKENI